MWWFPVVGNMPYLGFFDLESAREEKKRLLKEDLDVTIGMADAYSTLGWFRDPVTLNLIRGSVVDLVEVILHEMTHTTLYLKGQGEFNEGLANLVGKKGAFRFLKQEYGPSHPWTVEAKGAIEDERIFAAFLASLLEKLNNLYTSAIPYQEKLDQREQVFASALKDFGRLKKGLQTRRFVHFGSGGLNNAYILSVGLYHCHFPLFEEILEQKGNSIKAMLAFFKDLAQEKGDMLARAKERLSSSHLKPLRLNGRQGR
jgi:predicted aminopeptidase